MGVAMVPRGRRWASRGFKLGLLSGFLVAVFLFETFDIDGGAKIFFVFLGIGIAGAIVGAIVGSRFDAAKDD